MRFPNAEQLDLRCTLADYLPGQLHPDGRRYLPLLTFQLPAGDWPGANAALRVVDRHHRVDPALVGQSGHARLVLLLSQIALANVGAAPGFYHTEHAETMSVIGTVLAVPTWETTTAHLPYQTLHAELVLDVGGGTIGVRTNATAPDLAAQLGSARFTPGDLVRVWRSRIDVLAFQV